MVNFREIPKKIGDGLEVVKNFTQEQLRKREARLATPELQAKHEAMFNALVGDIRSAGGHGIDAMYRFALKGPFGALWEGVKQSEVILEHNLKVKNPKHKKDYSSARGKMSDKFLGEWTLGTISTAKFVGNIALALGRGGILIGRHTIGK